MKTSLLATQLMLAGCTHENYRDMTLDVVGDPARIAGTTSELGVPAACPIYTPSGGDIDTPEPPFRSPIAFSCGVDSAHQAYGLVTGDKGDLAIIPGDRELGVYVALDPGQTFDPSLAKAWAAPLALPCICGSTGPVVSGPLDAELPELQANARIPIQAVAAGSGGLLLTVGHFDDRSTQVVIDLGTTTSFRFYVNGVPGQPRRCVGDGATSGSRAGMVGPCLPRESI
jgi:hypothetical protein